MHVRLLPAPTDPIVYPESDGQPMADNTKQAQWIVVLYDNLKALFASRDDVFVGADLLWYPVQGKPDVRVAPDVLVAFGRPKGHRRSYQQWAEGGVPITVAFEIVSPKYTAEEMDEKLEFYDEHGVEEYYVYHPDRNRLTVFVRKTETLVRVRKVNDFVSPRLGIRFEMTRPEMTVYHPGGERFLPFEELQAIRLREADRADVAEDRAAKAQLLARRLAELSRKARLRQATPEELHELERLENEAAPPG